MATTKEYYVYDAISMVGEAGGYLGLFLGISCYQVLVMLCDWTMENRGAITKKMSSVSTKEGLNK